MPPRVLVPYQSSVLSLVPAASFDYFSLLQLTAELKRRVSRLHIEWPVGTL
jgi:hypothetical protein